MRICVTGGSGFIGGYFCAALRERGDEIVVLDLVEPDSSLPIDRFIKGDVRDEAAVDEALGDCDALLHLAAAHHDFGINEATFFSVNEQGTRVLCEAMDAHGITSAAFFSTVAVYGDAPPPLSEEIQPLPVSDYGRSKLAAEAVLKEWTGQGGDRRCLVIRPTVTFGPRNFANMYSLIRQVDSGRFIFASGATNIKSLSFIDNIVAATFYLWGCEGLPPFDVYNYVDTPDLTSVQIAETCCRSLERRIPRLRLPVWMLLAAAKPFDAVIALTGRNLPISSARIRKLFVDQTKFEAQKVHDSGFEAPLTLHEGIARMVAWYRDGGCEQSAQWHQPPESIVRMHEG